MSATKTQARPQVGDVRYRVTWIDRDLLRKSEGTMKRVRQAWNGGSPEAAMAAARRRTEEAIASGCERCPQCAGDGLLEALVCPTCGAAGFLVPPGGMPLPPTKH